MNGAEKDILIVTTKFMKSVNVLLFILPAGSDRQHCLVIFSCFYPLLISVRLTYSLWQDHAVERRIKRKCQQFVSDNQSLIKW